MGRGLIIALVASVALNVFAVGFFSGRVLNDKGPFTGPPPQEHEAGPPIPFRMMHIADALPPERRDEFRKAFRAKLPAMRDHFREMKELGNELSGLLAAENWDRASIEAKHAELNDLRDRQADAFMEAFLDAYETLTPEERAMLKAAADERRSKRRKFRSHRRSMMYGDHGPMHDGDDAPQPPEQE